MQKRKQTTKQKPPMKFILFWTTTPALEAAMECGWYIQWGGYTGDDRALRVLSVANSFLIRDGTVCPCFLCAAILSAWTLAGLCMLSVSKFICASVWLCLGDTAPLELSSSSGSYRLSDSSSAWISEHQGEEFNDALPFRDTFSKLLSFSAYCDQYFKIMWRFTVWHSSKRNYLISVYL